MKKIFLFASAVLALGLTSCSIDDVENIGEMSTSQFPATDEDASSVIAGVYQNLNKVSATPQASFIYMAQIASDDALGGGGPNDKTMQAYDFIKNDGADMTYQFYSDRFEGIGRANTMLQILDGAEGMDPTLRAQLTGETLSLRAYYYYELASMYGNVPLTTSPDDGDVVQGDYKALWGQILQDFYVAATTMPSVRKSDGHIDKYTAEALLGRAWLFASGMFCNGMTIADMTKTTYAPLKEWALPNGTTLTKQMVIELIDDCVNNSGYSLVPDFRNLWAYTNKYTKDDYYYTAGKGFNWVEDDAAVNPESMFAIKYNKQASWQTTIGYSNQYALHFGVRGDWPFADTFPFGQGWGAGPVAENLVTDWIASEPTDVRRDATVQLLSELPAYKQGGNGGFIQETDYFSKKWAPVSCKNDAVEGGYNCCFEVKMFGSDLWATDAKPENKQLNNIHDLVLLRFADVLLMQSELKEDVTGINLVRARAGLDPVGSYSLAVLQNERRWELAEEGVRWNDIRRWHIAAAALEKQAGTKVYTTGVAETNRGGYADRYNATAGFQKMPSTVLALGSCKQNDGWDDSAGEYGGW